MYQGIGLPWSVLYQGMSAYRSGSLPISRSAMLAAPTPRTSLDPSTCAIRGRLIRRLMPRMSLACVAWARFRAAAVHPGPRSYVSPYGRGMPEIGHHVRSVLKPPTRMSGWAGSGSRLRSSWAKTGLPDPGAAPASFGTVLYSNASPRKLGAIGRPVGVELTDIRNTYACAGAPIQAAAPSTASAPTTAADRRSPRPTSEDYPCSPAQMRRGRRPVPPPGPLPGGASTGAPYAGT